MADDHDWTTATPEEVDLDGEALAGIDEQFNAWKEANVHAALIARRGKLVAEHYFTGEDQAWGRDLGTVAYDRTMLHDLRSVTKSVVSLVYGIAQADHPELARLDTPVFDFFPEHRELATNGREAITLRHLLEMSAGLRWNEDVPYSDPENSEIRMTLADDRCRYVLEQDLVRPPGRSWIYSGGASALIAEIVSRAAGKEIDALATERLFAPLGIAEHDWLSYDDGVPIAASGLRLKPRDTLKLGQLVLQNGMWEGERIVPADWIAASTSPQINGQGLFFYGHHWWLGRSLVARREIGWTAGVGWGGQRLFIVPDAEMVVLVHAGLYGEPWLQSIPAEVVLRRYALASAFGHNPSAT